MKRLVVVLMLFALPLYAAMSDGQALKQARTLWGSISHIGTERGQTDSNWWKLVGVQSEGCQKPFTVIGRGFNTWDAAFADAAAHPLPVAGPFKSTINIHVTAWDDQTVAKVDLFIDSVRLNSTVTMPPTQRWDVSIPLNTTLLANGLHVVCAYVEDGTGKIGGSAQARLFTVDQNIVQAQNDWFMEPQPANGTPVISVPESIVAAQ